MSNPHIQLSDHFTYPRLLRFVAPSITMMIFTSIYGVVDGFFVSNYVGKTPFAALNFIMPFIMVLGGTGFMLGTGGSALVAKEMGCGHTERANRIFTMMIGFVVVTGLILTALGVAFIRPIARLMGASESIMADCVLYGRITIAFTTAFMLQSVFQSFLVVAERPRVGLLVVVAAGVANMVLDALFIAVFRWGLAGAALATALSQVVSFCILLTMCNTKADALSIRFSHFKPSLRIYGGICYNGIPSLGRQGIASISNILLNNAAGVYGDAAIAAMSIVCRYAMFINSSVIGFGQGFQPVCGFSYGAGKFGRVREAFWFCVKVVTVILVVLCVISLPFSGQIIALFRRDDPQVIEIGTLALRLQLLTLPLCELTGISGMPEDLARKLHKNRLSFASFSERTASSKDRQYTYARVSRCLFKYGAGDHPGEETERFKALGLGPVAQDPGLPEGCSSTALGNKKAFRGSHDHQNG